MANMLWADQCIITDGTDALEMLFSHKTTAERVMKREE